MSRKPLGIILFVAFVDLVGFGLIIPLQAVYATRLGATGLTFGLLVGVYSLMQLVFSPVLGRWSDRVGRRRVLLISISGSVMANIGFERRQAEALLILLSERGVSASAGAACSSGSLEPSHVLAAMGVDPKIAHGAIRFSLSRFTTAAEIDRAVEVLAEVIPRVSATMVRQP